MYVLYFVVHQYILAWSQFSEIPCTLASYKTDVDTAGSNALKRATCRDHMTTHLEDLTICLQVMMLMWSDY